MERAEMMKAAALHEFMESLGFLVELGVVPHGKARAMLAEVVGSSAKVAAKGAIGFKLSVVKPGEGGVIGVAA